MILAMVQTLAGLATIFVILCFFVSGLLEWISSARGWRGNSLKAGIRRMLPDQPIYRRVMQHTLIGGMYRDQAAIGRPPAHLAPANFAGALVDVVQRRAAVSGWRPGSGNRAAQLRSAVRTIQLDHPLIAQSLVPILDRAGDDFEKVQAGIEAWFNSAMERVGNWYNAYLRRRLFIAALIAAILGNFDAIGMTRGFWAAASHTHARGSMTAAAPSIPIFYECLSTRTVSAETLTRGCTDSFIRSALTLDGWLRLLGWLLTAFAVAIGAPYLFRMVARRGS